MKARIRVVALSIALALVAGCASTKVTDQTPMVAPGLARPNQIWVYNFIAAPSDVPAASSLAGKVSAPSTPPTAEQIETGRNLGALIAQHLVEDIQAMASRRYRLALDPDRKSATP